MENARILPFPEIFPERFSWFLCCHIFCCTLSLGMDVTGFWALSSFACLSYFTLVYCFPHQMYTPEFRIYPEKAAKNCEHSRSSINISQGANWKEKNQNKTIKLRCWKKLCSYLGSGNKYLFNLGKFIWTSVSSSVKIISSFLVALKFSNLKKNSCKRILCYLVC